MFWASIAALYGCVLLFIANNKRLASFNSYYISTPQLTSLLRVIGIFSLTFSGLLWVSMHGWGEGFIYLLACVVGNAILLFGTKPKIKQLIGGAVLLIGSSFIWSTANMVSHSLYPY
ncbi:hypothetical protein [Psychrobium sp. 1_MG-2023]|uniref:hypothetical protein n=1 Tax=Psychrobium sp. 1_MG-2023 TaxID=3062624 RepID=UPI000C343D97|nr:hypothetical protein [Psychrobium sp. 1_MG-2023]MDP2560002.1 hypothetical protein [Psychrobium sp. 1_MG-2023]PKF56336.1 hypothetical protein CW748_10275 [Alteromonadales bacterium alter-6D02]